MVYDQQALIEGCMNRRDEIFNYFTRETSSFARITVKILNELINQNNALSKRITSLFKLSLGGADQIGTGNSEDQNSIIATLNKEILDLKTRLQAKPVRTHTQIIQRSQEINFDQSNICFK